MATGGKGVVRVWNDFTAPPGGITTGVPDALFNNLGGGVGLIGVNEGVLALTVDEDGGILDITTDTADNDNQALVAGVWKPSSGGMYMECRCKIPDSVATTRAAVFVGFSETMAMDTPVMPAETATATTTYNGSGGMAGFVMDSDATTIAWRFVAGDAGAALATVAGAGAVGLAAGAAGTAIGITANHQTLTADRWYLFRVEITPAGIARGYFGDIGSNDQLKHVGSSSAALGTSDCFHAVALIENRSGANERLEVDYFEAEGYRDWAAD
jgi:hypothetical protein